MAWQGRSMPHGWGDSQPCTDFARIDVSDAQVGTKKRALRSNQETDEGKLRRPGQLLDKENLIQGPWCRFRRVARARERHRHTVAMVGSLKVLENGRLEKRTQLGHRAMSERCQQQKCRS